jgi:hypothetical protein
MSLKARPSLFLLPELGNQLIHNFHSEGFGGQMSEHNFCGGRYHRLERQKLLDHLSMAEGTDLHPLQQVTSHHRRTDYGKAQLVARACRRVSCSTCSQHSLLDSSSRRVRQSLRVLLGHISSLAHLRKITLDKGHPSSKVLGLPMSRGQRRSALRLHS